MSKTSRKKIAKCLLWSLVWLPVLVIGAPFLLYVPFVQDIARDIAIEKVHESTGMTIDIGYLRLRFPLRLQVDSLTVVEAQGDTMVTASSAKVTVALMPLLKKRIDVSSLELTDATYRLGTPDSAMYLTARIERFDAGDTDIPLSFERIALRKAVLDGADITLVMKDTVTAEKPDTAASKPMVIDVGHVELRRVTYRMAMLPTIDSLGARIGVAKLTRGHIDTGRQLVEIDRLTVDSVSATYLTPTQAYLDARARSGAAATDSVAPEVTSAPWTVTARELRLTARDALYATRGALPARGFDPQYIAVTDAVVEVDSFYNRATEVRVPLRHLAARERCGIALMASGVFSMDSTLMEAGRFNIATPNSNIYVDASMGVGDFTADPKLPLRLEANGTLSMLDARLFMPSLSAYLGSLPASAGLRLVADIHGTPASLAVDRLNINLPGYIALGAEGRIDNPLDFNRMSGRVDLKGSVGKLRGIEKAVLPASLAGQFAIPPMKIDGSVIYRPGNIDGNVAVRTEAGEMKLEGRWNDRAEGYHAILEANRFPLGAFMPKLGVGRLSADVLLDGRGYNPASRATRMKADVDLRSVEYNGASLGNIKLGAALDTCRLTVQLISDNTFADLDADLAATFASGGYTWDLSSDVRYIDLHTMRLLEGPANGSALIYTRGSYNPRSGDIDAELELDELDWLMDSLHFELPQLTARLLSTDTLTNGSLASGDFDMSLTAMTSLTDVVKRLTAAADIADYQVRERKIDVDSLQSALPHVALSVDMGPDNPVAGFLAEQSDLHFEHFCLYFANDSLITINSRVDKLESGSVDIDRLTFDANQHGKYLVYTAAIDNNPGTMDNFAHVGLRGFVAADKVSAMLSQKNIDGEQGFMIGVNAAVADSTVTLRFVPHMPTIAYKKWKINSDNILAYNFVERHLDANLKLMSDSSYLHVYTEHAEHVPDSAVTASGHPEQDDVIVKLANINLQEWLSISPFAPPVKGDLAADLRFRWDAREITGNGTVAVNDLYYGRDRVGTFDLDVDVANDNRAKALHADVALFVDGQKVITATGALNDSTAVSPFLLDFDMIRFPLHVVNPFLPKGVAQLSGVLNGKMDITGDMANPVFNGFLDFDSTAVKLGMTGASYRFSEEKIPVDSNVVRFDGFKIYGLDDNALQVDGTVDAHRLTDIAFDLSMQAKNLLLVNSKRAKSGADVYGKALVDLDATAAGNMRFMRVDAKLDVLPGTNVTYVLTDAQQTLSAQSADDMVRFVSFADTATTVADSVMTNSMAMILDADLAISEGSTINVDLSPDGKNKASVQGSGAFNYTLTPLNDLGRLTGRFTINSGFVRYTPSISTGGMSMSIMSEKNFSFAEGSYVAFNGDIMNPTLKVSASDRIKANVTQSGQNSRLVNFDVTVSITNTLQNLNVAFDLSTDDDITIQNELTSMSPEQRANQAMNMLLYNRYTGPGAKGNGNLSGNPLYSFLASQLNTWAANNIRGVDISFGIDQYDTTTDGTKSTTTSYSYRVSKTLFDNRFKIVVGGNYSTDADADENFSQNLINDISFEYMINRSGTMYVRLFRHVGFESILEGEITQTGVGFVMKRKLNTLRDLFRFGSGKSAPSLLPAAAKPVKPSIPKADETDSIR